MADTYVKIWASIVDSSIWSQDMATRLVWITMLVMADEHGFVGASVSGIARRANVTLDEAHSAIASLESPDPESRSEFEEGRRIRRVERGWHIINHSYFKDLRDKEARKAYERERKREYRERLRKSHGVQDKSGTEGGLSQMSAHASESASAPAPESDLASQPEGGSAVDQKGEGNPSQLSEPGTPAEPEENS